MATVLEEFIGFLKPGSASLEARRAALDYILGLSANTTDGLEFLLGNRECLSAIFSIAQDTEDKLNEIALLCLLNITTEEEGTLKLLEFEPLCYVNMLNSLVTSSPMAKCQILANATRLEQICESISDHCLKNSSVFSSLINCFNSADSLARKDYDYLALVFGNLAKCSLGRSLFFTNTELLKSLFIYTIYPQSEVRRHGVAILIKNICFDIDKHPLLLDSLQILPPLLLPLIGPDEELTEEEMEKLPLTCQYLGNDKEREPSLDIKVLILQALFKLCSTKHGRSHLRDNGAYFVLRELHKWEKDGLSTLVCEHIVEILIRDESDVGADNLMDVKIPDHLEKQFEKQSYSQADNIG